MTRSVGSASGRSRAGILVLATGLAATAACAQVDTVSHDGGQAAGATKAVAANPADPWEGMNRRVFGFNESLDKHLLVPVARGYRRAVPEVVRTGVDNVLGNVSDAWSALNHLLQGKVMSAGAMTLRVATNTVFGIGGLLDPATEMGLDRQSEDFGQTLGRWGVASGPYVVLPLLGPSTLRDTLVLPVDQLGRPSTQVEGTRTALAVTTLQVVSTRAGLLSASSLLDDIAFDKYSFLRDAYRTRRLNQVYDGNPPETD